MIGIGLVLGAGIAEARRARPRKKGPWVVGHVVQVTADRVFVDFGSAFGLRAGDALAVRLPNRSWLRLKLADVSRFGASATLPENVWPPNGSLARARRRSPVAQTPAKKPRLLPRPEAAELMTARWSGVNRARPAPVAYTRTLAAKAPPPRTRTRGSLRLEYMGLVNIGGSIPTDFHQFGVWSDLDVPRLLVPWLDYSHRMRFRLQIADDLDQRRFQHGHKPIPLIYRARFGLNLDPFQAQLGRMLGAPTPESEVVDGATTRMRLGRWLYVGAYGGFLPRPIDLRPSAEATQFGGYASLRLSPETGRFGAKAWAVLADVGFVGSTWQGDVDRKALTARAAFDWGGLSFSGHAVVDLYESGHPNGRPQADLTTLSTAADVRLSPALEIGARYDRYRLAATREALAFLGSGYVDQTTIDSARGSCDVRLGTQTWIGGQGGFDRQGDDGWVGWGELMLRLGGLFHDEDLLRVSLSANRGNVLLGVGGRAAYARPLWRWLYATLSYGLHRDQYAAVDRGTLRHDLSVGADAMFGRGWLVGTEVGAILSNEDRVLQIFTTLAYAF